MTPTHGLAEVEAQTQTIRRLRDHGGLDIQIVDGRIYEIAVRELDATTVRQATKTLAANLTKTKRSAT